MLYILSMDLYYNTFFTFIPFINRHKQYLEQSKNLKVPNEQYLEMLNTHVHELLRYMDCAMSWIVNHGSKSGGGKTFFLYSQPPDCLWDVFSILYNGHCCWSTHLCVMPKLRICGAVWLPTYTSVWHCTWWSMLTIVFIDPHHVRLGGGRIYRTDVRKWPNEDNAFWDVTYIFTVSHLGQ
jgi:hypothetical protein